MAPLLRALAALGLPLLASASAANATGQHAAGAAAEAKVTPLQKLLQLLDGLSAKVKQGKHEEKVEFTKFHVWCSEVRAARSDSIAKGEAQIESLEAGINKAKADAAGLAGEVAGLEAEIAKAKADVESATALRRKESADYSATHQDLSESVDACERAIQTLKAKSADVPQALLQLQRSPRTPARERAALAAFLALRAGGGAEAGAPEAKAYEFQSGGVITILEKLRQKFKEQRYALEKAEMNAKHNYQLLAQQLEDDVKGNSESSAAKAVLKASRLEAAASAEADLQTARATKADDEKVLGDTDAQCLVRSEEFEKNQLTRADEVKAIEEAMEILSSSSVKGAADAHLPAAALLQGRRPAARALVQLPGTPADAAAEATAEATAARHRAVEFLQAKAAELGSHYLLLAAARAAADPFAKVKQLIKNLLLKLTEEATSEAEQHAYCTSEMGVNRHTRETKAAEVDELTARTEHLTAESTRLTTEMKELSDAVAEIRAEQSEAQKAREEDKKSNEKTIAEAQEAQTAVETATQVLREFYGRPAEGSLLQGGSRGRQRLRQGQAAKAKAKAATAAKAAKAAKAARDPYSGEHGASSGIFGLLEVVLSDFARLETETSTAEDAAASGHAKFMSEADGSVEVKEFDIERKKSKKQLTDERLRNTKKELGLTQDELSKALEYHDRLQAQCVDTDLSFEERKASREQEIQALKEALEILEQGGASA